MQTYFRSNQKFVQTKLYFIRIKLNSFSLKNVGAKVITLSAVYEECFERKLLLQDISQHTEIEGIHCQITFKTRTNVKIRDVNKNKRVLQTLQSIK